MPKPESTIDTVVIYILTAFIAPLLSPITLSAAADTKSTMTLWENKEEFVRIEPQDDPAAPQNAHPVEIPAQRVTDMLRVLRVRLADSEDQSPLPVFSNQELELLGKHLSRGLSQARPRQDVTFATIGTRSVTTGGFFRKRLVNTGRVFYADGNLNVIFGELLGSVKKKNIYGRRDQDFSQRHYGLRTESRETEWEVLTSPGVDFHIEGNQARADWVLIDSNAALARDESQQPSPPEVSEPPPPAAAAVVAAPIVMPPEHVPPPPVVPAEGPTGAEEANARSEAAESPSDLEGRLERLKELRDKDLITEEAYQEKMREILSDL